jgi:hypothetical protein
MTVLAAALAPVHQQYLDEARQMQALSEWRSPWS